MCFSPGRNGRRRITKTLNSRTVILLNCQTSPLTDDKDSMARSNELNVNLLVESLMSMTGMRREDIWVSFAASKEELTSFYNQKRELYAKRGLRIARLYFYTTGHGCGRLDTTKNRRVFHLKLAGTAWLNTEDILSVLQADREDGMQVVFGVDTCCGDGLYSDMSIFYDANPEAIPNKLWNPENGDVACFSAAGWSDLPDAPKFKAKALIVGGRHVGSVWTATTANILRASAGAKDLVDCLSKATDTMNNMKRLKIYPWWTGKKRTALEPNPFPLSGTLPAEKVNEKTIISGLIQHPINTLWKPEKPFYVNGVRQPPREKCQVKWLRGIDRTHGTSMTKGAIPEEYLELWDECRPILAEMRKGALHNAATEALHVMKYLWDQEDPRMRDLQTAFRKSLDLNGEFRKALVDVAEHLQTACVTLTNQVQDVLCEKFLDHIQNPAQPWSLDGLFDE